MLETKPHSIGELIDTITPEVYQKLKTAIELGKWESGESLSEEQKEYCLQAIIAYEHRHVPLEQRTGFMAPGATASTHCAKKED